jgi:hypothetical protein
MALFDRGLGRPDDPVALRDPLTISLFHSRIPFFAPALRLDSAKTRDPSTLARCSTLEPESEWGPRWLTLEFRFSVLGM